MSGRLDLVPLSLIYFVYVGVNSCRLDLFNLSLHLICLNLIKFVWDWIELVFVGLGLELIRLGLI